MIKKIIYLSILGTFIFILSGSLALAQGNVNTNPTANRRLVTIHKNIASNVAQVAPTQNFKLIRESIRKDLKQNTKALRIEARAKIQTLRKEEANKMEALKARVKKEKNKATAKKWGARITAREHVLVKFEVVINTIENIRARIDAQVNKFQSEGISIPSATTDLSTQAEAKIIAAKAIVVDTNNLLTKSLNQISRADINTIISASKNVHTLLKDARSLLINEIRELRKIVPKNPASNTRGNTTNTTQTSTSN